MNSLCMTIVGIISHKDITHYTSLLTLISEAEKEY